MKNKHKKVLNWVNARRKDLGLKAITCLPKGERESADSCPIANAFSCSSIKEIEVYSYEDLNISREIAIPQAVRDFAKKVKPSDDEVYDAIGFLLEKTLNSRETFSVPKYVSEFIDKFDDGQYPELVEE